jgi:pimeloyl-ACP methyl ester carboxylesterase
MVYSSRDSIEFYYEVHGSGMPLVFSHGLGGDTSQAWELLQDLPAVKLIIYDNRGHGRTTGFGDASKLTFAAMADDMAALLDTLGIFAAIIGGVSMGAGIALAFGLRNKERTKALILSRPAWLDQPFPPHLAIFPEIAQKVKVLGRESALRWFEESEYYKSLVRDFPEAAKSLLGLFAKRNMEALTFPFRFIPASTPYDSSNELEVLDVPALVLANRDDPLHPFACADTLAAALPQAHLCEFASKSQSVEEHKRQFRDHVSKFLAGLS